MIVKSHKLLVVTSSSCIAPSVLDSLSFAAVLFVRHPHFNIEIGFCK
ncbi:hypothetical protein QWZ13_14170 [Reinekea marina]|nr:hypothetical protein [Reinekea marina]MDN3650062.1 hypothetical protein [Reinekea marina]